MMPLLMPLLLPFQSTPAPGAPAATPGPQSTATTIPTGVDPALVYRGMRERREVLRNQKERLLDEREELVQDLRQGGALSQVDRTGIEGRITAIDLQLTEVNLSIAQADADVATTAAIPGAHVEAPEPNPWQYGPPEEVVLLSIVFSALLLFPVMIAWARRIWRRSSTPSPVPAELIDRIASMERNLDSVAIEIERVGEGQRFVTQLLASREESRAALPSDTGRARG